MPVVMARAPSDRTSLRRRVGVMGCVFVALVVFSVGLATLMVRAWDRAVDDRGQLRIATAEVADLRLAYSDQETGIRGYLLAQDPRFLQPYEDGVTLAQTMQRRLRTREPGMLQQTFLARARELDDILARAHLEDFCVANDNRSVTDVAAEVLKLADW